MAHRAVTIPGQEDERQGLAEGFSARAGVNASPFRLKWWADQRLVALLGGSKGCEILTSLPQVDVIWALRLFRCRFAVHLVRIIVLPETHATDLIVTSACQSVVATAGTSMPLHCHAFTPR